MPHGAWKLECICGKQTAEFVEEGLRLLCRSCKRITTIPYEKIGSFEKAVAYAKAQRRRGRPGE